MYPKNISEYLPTDSERIVYQELKNQLPDTFDVFYSVSWTSYYAGRLVKSEADFIVASPDYGFLCLEVKGGNGIRIEDNNWYLSDAVHGERKLNSSPYDQAEKNMYYFSKVFSSKYNTKYSGIYGAGVIFPFYPIGEELELSNRHRTCTIDSNDLNNIYDRIKKMFRLWAGSSYGRRYYPASQHRAFLELIRDRIAISAAAGALIRFKDQQLSVINRVQDNYVYLLKNVKQFYMRGGAGTGKTWIAMKMAKDEAESNGHKVLFVCASKPLASMVNSHIGDAVDVKDIRSLFEMLVEDITSYQEPLFEGISHGLIGDYEKYNAIFVDEAQDFTEEWASIIRLLLDDPEGSRLGVFFDDVQVLREESFGNGFGIGELPYLLRENIRNTANIYNWTAEKTNLGTDMVANPVEGPTPTTEIVNEHGQLVLLFETLFKRYLEKEYLKNDSLVILTESKEKLLAEFPDGIAKWKFVHGTPSNENEISVYPPLLAAFIRALSELLISYNGVALIATHSPVILQEVPRKCAWKLNRNGNEVTVSRLEIESFGATIGALTREVFGLEVRQSGFHKMLCDEVNKGLGYGEIKDLFHNELGDEALALLRTLLALRDEDKK